MTHGKVIIEVWSCCRMRLVYSGECHRSVVAVPATTIVVISDFINLTNRGHFAWSALPFPIKVSSVTSPRPPPGNTLQKQPPAPENPGFSNARRISHNPQLRPA